MHYTHVYILGYSMDEYILEVLHRKLKKREKKREREGILFSSSTGLMQMEKSCRLRTHALSRS